MIVYDLNLPGIVIGPAEANPPLIVDPDAHLAGSITLQDLQSISGGISQILQSCRGIQLAQGPLMNFARKLPGGLALPNASSVRAPD